jgi:hypothetical protein
VVAHPDVARDSRYAFDVLREVLGQGQIAHGLATNTAELDRNAMFVWSSMHGLAIILQSDAIVHLGLDTQTRGEVPAHAVAMVDRALEGTRRPGIRT